MECRPRGSPESFLPKKASGVRQDSIEKNGAGKKTLGVQTRPPGGRGEPGKAPESDVGGILEAQSL